MEVVLKYNKKDLNDTEIKDLKKWQENIETVNKLYKENKIIIDIKDWYNIINNTQDKYLVALNMLSVKSLSINIIKDLDSFEVIIGKKIDEFTDSDFEEFTIKEIKNNPKSVNSILKHIRTMLNIYSDFFGYDNVTKWLEEFDLKGKTFSKIINKSAVSIDTLKFENILNYIYSSKSVKASSVFIFAYLGVPNEKLVDIKFKEDIYEDKIIIRNGITMSDKTTRDWEIPISEDIYKILRIAYLEDGQESDYLYHRQPKQTAIAKKKLPKGEDPTKLTVSGIRVIINRESKMFKDVFGFDSLSYTEITKDAKINRYNELMATGMNRTDAIDIIIKEFGEWVYDANGNSSAEIRFPANAGKKKRLLKILLVNNNQQGD